MFEGQPQTEIDALMKSIPSSSSSTNVTSC